MRHQVYAETSARLTFFAPVICDLLPNSRFLFIHRHPAAVIRSGMRRNWYVDHPADRGRIEPVAGETAYAKWTGWTQFEKICWYWDAYNRFALDFTRNCDPDRVRRVEANSLFDGSDISSIFHFLSMESPNERHIADVLRRCHKEQICGDFALFEDWTDDQKSILEELAGDTMAQLGYVARPAARHNCQA